MIAIDKDPTLTAALESFMDKLLWGDLKPTTSSGSSSGASGSSSTSSSSSAGEVEAAPASLPPCMNLSPDALMSYCESRLSSLDNQMSQIMDQQQANATQTAALDKLSSLLNELPGPNSSTPPMVDVSSSGNQKLVGEISSEYMSVAGTLGPSSPIAGSLLKDQASFLNALTKNGGKQLSSDVVNQLEQNIKNDTATLNSNSEMIMIDLQSLMSQRQTAVQLTTNLVQSLGDQANSIAKNIGQ
jgi:hypothetical protein